MPTLQVTTKASKSVWKTPDGQREIFEVTFDYEGQEISAKTWSGQIATVGWSGLVESYEKEGKNGPQTFVKQPPKEGASYGSTGGGTYGSSKSAYVPKDEKAIKAMWSIGQAVAAHNGNESLDVADLPSVEAYAVELFAMVDRVKGAEESGKTNVDEVIDVTGTENNEELLKGIDEIFPSSKKETPWPQN